MRAFIRYNWYVIKHRWFVMLECFFVAWTTRTPALVWRGLTHDLSKFSITEQRGYLRRFGGSITTDRDKSGGYVPTDSTDDLFLVAWAHHSNSNDHHWEWWCTPRHDEQMLCNPMSYPAILEMMCDWMGAARAQGTPKEAVDTSVRNWYLDNKQRLLLHPDTRTFVEVAIGHLYMEVAPDLIVDDEMELTWE